MPEHEHIDEHGEGFHRELRHREIRRPEAEKHRRHAVADSAECEHGRHRRLREGRRDRTRDDDEHDENVVRRDAGAGDRGTETGIGGQGGAPNATDVATITMM